jgi:hypothetical protein
MMFLLAIYAKKKRTTTPRGDKMNAARASHPSRIKREVPCRAPLPFAGVPRGLRSRLVLREERLPSAVAGFDACTPVAGESVLPCGTTLVKVSFECSHECAQTRRLGAITLEGIAYLIRRAMLVQRAQDNSTLRLQTLCRMCGRGTTTIRLGAVRKLWVVGICCGRLRIIWRKCLAEMMGGGNKGKEKGRTLSVRPCSIAPCGFSRVCRP